MDDNLKHGQDQVVLDALGEKRQNVEKLRVDLFTLNMFQNLRGPTDQDFLLRSELSLMFVPEAETWSRFQKI